MYPRRQICGRFLGHRGAACQATRYSTREPANRRNPAKQPDKSGLFQRQCARLGQISSRRRPDACGLVTFAIPNQTAENQFVTRVDWTINAKNSFYGRYWLDGYQKPAFYSPTNILITGQTGNYERVQGLTLG